MKPSVPPTALVKPEVICAPVDMALCDATAEIVGPADSDFKPWVKGLIIDKGVCRTKQANLISCINAYNKAP